MRAKWTVGRIFLSLATVTFLGAGVWGLWAGWKWQHDLVSCRTSKVMEGAVDISAPGEFEFRYLQSTQIPHAAEVWLRLPEEFLALNDPETLFEPLKATVSVTGDSGLYRELTNVSTLHLNRARRCEGMIPLFRLPLIGKEPGNLKVVIHQGVPVLKGVPQHLEGRYRLCGCEGIPIYIFNGLGGVCTVIGGLLAVAFYQGNRLEKERVTHQLQNIQSRPTDGKMEPDSGDSMNEAGSDLE